MEKRIVITLKDYNNVSTKHLIRPSEMHFEFIARLVFQLVLGQYKNINIKTERM